MIVTFQQAQAKAKVAYLDGRLDTLAYKHKQLGALFELLQAHGTSHIGEKSSKQLGLELEHTLRGLASLISQLPTNLTGTFEAHQSLKDVINGKRAQAVGTVIIVHSSAQPFSSWALPLGRAIVDGNAAIILVSPQAANTVPRLGPHLDTMAYQMVTTDFGKGAVGGLGSLDGVVGPARSLAKLFPTVPVGSTHIRPLGDGAVPVIVDQSFLRSGKPLTPDEEARGVTPGVLQQLAKRLAAINAVIDGPRVPLGCPSFVLVHENIAKPFARALESAGVSFTPEELSAVQDQAKPYLDNLQGGKRGHLPVYTVRSIDMAIDFVQDNIWTPSTVYVFASAKFSAYAFNSLVKVHNICIDGLSVDQVVLGPYADIDALSFTTNARLVKSSLTEAIAPCEDLYKLSYPHLKRIAGHRIDFFGGSFMFAAGTTVLFLLGGTGIGLFNVARLTYHKFVR